MKALERKEWFAKDNYCCFDPQNISKFLCQTEEVILACA
jgi:hypothetical protein